MKVEKTIFDDAYVLKPRVFGDDRGYFHEVYHKEKFKSIGLDVEFVQDNLSFSTKGILRGMHFQWNPHQGKLVRAVKGSVYDVIVDIKKGSPTFGKWYGVELSDENHKMFWVPPGYAHSFLVLSDDAIVEYKCTGVWNGESEGSILYNDPTIGVEWPLSEVIVSEKDMAGMTLQEWQESPEFETFNETLPKSLALKTD